ncbi:MAG: PqqD family protein [Sphingomonadaceae bacterium]
MAEISGLQSWKPADHVVYSDLGTSIALLDTRKNTYFTLDGIGPFLWSRIINEANYSDLCTAVVAEYSVDHETASGDIADFVRQLLRAALIHVNND